MINRRVRPRPAAITNWLLGAFDHRRKKLRRRPSWDDEPTVVMPAYILEGLRDNSKEAT